MPHYYPNLLFTAAGLAAFANIAVAIEIDFNRDDPHATLLTACPTSPRRRAKPSINPRPARRDPAYASTRSIKHTPLKSAISFRD